MKKELCRKLYGLHFDGILCSIVTINQVNSLGSDEVDVGYPRNALADDWQATKTAVHSLLLCVQYD